MGYRYSKLDQVNAKNIDRVGQVCAYKLGEQGSFQGAPLVYDSNGNLKWRYRIPAPPVAGLTATAGGLVLTADTDGDVFAVDARTVALLRRIALRAGAIDGGLITYSVGGKQFIAVAAGDNNPTYQAKGDNTIVILGLQ